MEVVAEYTNGDVHRLSFGEDWLFADLAGRVRMARIYNSRPVPGIGIRDFQKVPAGFLSFREYIFYPEVFEEWKKLLHPILLVEVPVEVAVIEHEVLVTSNRVEERELHISELKIADNRLILTRSFSSSMQEERFILKEVAGDGVARSLAPGDGVERAYIVESAFAEGKERLKLRRYRTLEQGETSLSFSSPKRQKQ